MTGDPQQTYVLVVCPLCHTRMHPRYDQIGEQKSSIKISGSDHKEVTESAVGADKFGNDAADDGKGDCNLEPGKNIG